MEAFEAILSIVIIAIAVLAKNKKKKVKQNMEAIRQQVMTVPSDHQADMRPVVVQQSMMMPLVEEHTEKSAAKAAPASQMPVPEGVDPCHDDMFAPRENTEILLNTAETVSPVGQELVRGFVMGEILSRPKFKTAGRN